MWLIHIVRFFGPAWLDCLVFVNFIVFQFFSVGIYSKTERREKDSDHRERWNCHGNRMGAGGNRSDLGRQGLLDQRRVCRCRGRGVLSRCVEKKKPQWSSVCLQCSIEAAEIHQHGHGQNRHLRQRPRAGLGGGFRHAGKFGGEFPSENRIQLRSETNPDTRGVYCFDGRKPKLPCGGVASLRGVDQWKHLRLRFHRQRDRSESQHGIFTEFLAGKGLCARWRDRGEWSDGKCRWGYFRRGGCLYDDMGTGRALASSTVPSRPQGTIRPRPQYSVPCITVDIQSSSLYDDWSITAVQTTVFVCLIDWLLDWLLVRLIDWLFDWLIDIVLNHLGPVWGIKYGWVQKLSLVVATVQYDGRTWFSYGTFTLCFIIGIIMFLCIGRWGCGRKPDKWERMRPNACWPSSVKMNRSAWISLSNFSAMPHDFSDSRFVNLWENPISIAIFNPKNKSWFSEKFSKNFQKKKFF